MKRISIALLALASGLMAADATLAQGSRVYSWVDENGVRHFSDRAPANQEVQSEELPESDFPASSDAWPTLNNEAMPSESAPADLAEQVPEGAGSDTSELSYADQKRQEMQQRREEQQRIANERNRTCMQARDQLARLEPSRRVFYTNESGETQRMDDDERVALVEESKQLIADNCD